jgi:TM2 domain-containing membrane protein YozV
MKKLLSIASMLVLMVIASTSSVKAENYVINDAAVEAAFTSAIAVPMSVDFINTAIPNIPTDQANVTGGTNAWIAVVLCYFLGGLGIHRFYLGTATLTGIGYILTCGGCGVVVTVDFFLLLIGAIKNDIGKYEDNTKFFMW